MVQSWHTNYQKWHARKEKVLRKNKDRVSKGKNPITFNEHPPRYPTAGKVGITYYKGEFKDISFHTNTISLKVWDGSDWVFITVEIDGTTHASKLHNDKTWQIKVPTIYEKEGIFYLTISFEKKSNVVKFKDHYQQPSPWVLSIDLNMGKNNRAVCSLIDKQGTVHKVKHIGLDKCNTTDVHRLLGLIAREVSKLKLIPKGHRPCKKLWRKVNAVNDNYAHHLSKRIVDMAKEWEVKVIVFENLNRFRPDRTRKGSRRMRQKLAYWLHRRVIRYATYKSKPEGILIALIPPKNTSRRCSICGSLETVRNGESLHCTGCDTRHNSHINASINVGLAWFVREEKRAS